ncbi:MAG: hypothetical protein ACJA0I_000093 [Gammaproteobacteria bacterium]|jgi:hypothetical protein
MLSAPNPLPRLQSVCQQETSFHLIWKDGSQSDFYFLWFRDNCPMSVIYLVVSLFP